MEDSKEKTPQPEAKVTSDIQQFQALGAWCTPEFLIKASQSVQSLERVGEQPDGPASAMAGRYLASRTLLASADQVSQVRAELRQRLRASSEELDSANRNELLQLWMSAERCLTEEEYQKYFPAVLDRLFPGHKTPGDLRDERTARKGGY